MNLTIKYFGMLAELTGCTEENIHFQKNTGAELLDQLYGKYPTLKNTSFKIAQNQEIIQKEEILSSNEVVLLPPFSGG